MTNTLDFKEQAPCTDLDDINKATFGKDQSFKGAIKDHILKNLKSKLDKTDITTLFNRLDKQEPNNITEMDDDTQRALALITDNKDLIKQLETTFVAMIRSMERKLHGMINEGGEEKHDENKEVLEKSLKLYKSFFVYDEKQKTVSLDNLIKLIKGEEVDLNEAKQAAFNESIYQERAENRHQEITDGDFELLKKLTPLYSYRMQGDVKMHKFDGEEFYIPDYNKVGLKYSDMNWQESGRQSSKVSFENLKNAPKMKELAKINNLDLSTISFQESLKIFFHFG